MSARITAVKRDTLKPAFRYASTLMARVTPNRHRTALPRPPCSDQIARHGLIDLEIEAQGDLHIDAHHTVEDIGITLGQAVKANAGRQARHPPLQPRLRPTGRSATGGARLFRPAGTGLFAEFPRARIGDFDVDLFRRILPGLRQPCADRPCNIDSLRGSKRPPYRRNRVQSLRPLPCTAVEFDPRVTGAPSTKGSL